ncbi:MAG: hypothetical protein JWO60_532, partial [Frankiales bacterium]|nr:hypothetical protein [Frankiales bacterium]
DSLDAGPPVVQDGRLDAVALARVEAALRAAARSTAGPVAALRRAPTTLVPQVLADGVGEARARVDTVPDDLASGADALDALAGLTGSSGQRRLVVVLQNNAELRGTGGLPSVFAEATARDGRLRLEAFRDVDEVSEGPATARRVPAPEDYRRLWGTYKADTTLWKNLGMTADVPTASGVLSGLSRLSLAAPADGVVWLDVRAVAAVLGATSPARLPDGTVLDGDNAVKALLSDAYAAVGDDERSQGLRSLRLQAAADAVVTRLLEGSPDLARLAPALSRAARGRHLALWSARPAEQASLERAGLAGALGPAPGDISSFTLNNLGGGGGEGNKLDYYGRRLVEVRTVLHDGVADVTQRVTVRNTAPASGLPVYVAGKDQPGTFRALVTLALPRAAARTTFERGAQSLAVQPLPEQDHAVLTDVLVLRPGESVTWTLRYRLPLQGERYRLRVVPQPLAVDAGLDLQVVRPDGTALRAAPGSTPLVLTGPLDAVLDVDAGPAPRGLLRRSLDRVRRFWNEPVELR